MSFYLSKDVDIIFEGIDDKYIEEEDLYINTLMSWTRLSQEQEVYNIQKRNTQGWECIVPFYHPFLYIYSFYMPVHLLRAQKDASLLGSWSMLRREILKISLCLKPLNYFPFFSVFLWSSGSHKSWGKNFDRVGDGGGGGGGKRNTFLATDKR